MNQQQARGASNEARVNQHWGDAQQNSEAPAVWNSSGQQTQQQSCQQRYAAWQQRKCSATNFVVSGCAHATVGVLVRGTYKVIAKNHGKPVYKRDQQPQALVTSPLSQLRAQELQKHAHALDVLIYFWDERDGPNFCGWWFGPKVGGDQVWAYHPDKRAFTPPQHGWKVPYDGPVDPTFMITPPKLVVAAVTQQQVSGMPRLAAVDHNGVHQGGKGGNTSLQCIGAYGSEFIKGKDNRKGQTLYKGGKCPETSSGKGKSKIENTHEGLERKLRSNIQNGCNNEEGQMEPQSKKLRTSAGECVVCLDNPASHLVVPCGHQALCKDCAKLFTASMECPCCRGPVERIIQVFVAAPVEVCSAPPGQSESANGPVSNIQRLTEMGFEKPAAEAALASSGDNVGLAIAMLAPVEACSPSSSFSESACCSMSSNLKRLIAMGFEKNTAEVALANSEDDVQLAIAMLCSAQSAD